MTRLNFPIEENSLAPGDCSVSAFGLFEFEMGSHGNVTSEGSERLPHNLKFLHEHGGPHHGQRASVDLTVILLPQQAMKAGDGPLRSWIPVAVNRLGWNRWIRGVKKPC